MDGSAATERAQPKTAAIIVIGDEILKGQTQDTNTFFLTRGLRSLGVSVARVSVIPDCVDTIATETKQFSAKFDLVLTSGGIGPTHDDLTFEGIAAAFERKVEFHPQLVELCQRWFKKTDLTEPCFKLARIPQQARLNFGVDRATGKPTQYPIVSVNNVFIFPGIPELLQRAFTNLGEQLFQAGPGFLTTELYFSSDELSLTAQLNSVVAAHPQVTVGSYPAWSGQYYRTKITLEAATADLLEAARREMVETMHPVQFDPSPEEDSYGKINTWLSDCQDAGLVEVVRASLATMEECFTRYQPDQVSVCFNGGKDCVVMLHLVHAVHQKIGATGTRLKSFYISEEKTFPEVDSFMTATVERYSLANKEFPGPMRPALAAMLEQDSAVQATVLGVRRGDPGSAKLSSFSPTDGDWPRVMRVNPVLDWTYHQVWTFIRGLSLPYPSLYDRGYTSLGNPDNTVPNPLLAFTEAGGLTGYRAAHTLQDPSQERRGRL